MLDRRLSSRGLGLLAVLAVAGGGAVTNQGWPYAAILVAYMLFAVFAIVSTTAAINYRRRQETSIHNAAETVVVITRTDHPPQISF